MRRCFFQVLIFVSVLTFPISSIADENPDTTKTLNIITREGTGWYNNLELASSEAKKQHKFILLDFSTEGCPWCSELEKKTYNAPEIKDKLISAFVLCCLNPQEARGYRGKYKIVSVPTLLIVDCSGKELFRHDGYIEPKDFIEKFFLPLEKSEGWAKKREIKEPVKLKKESFTETFDGLNIKMRYLKGGSFKMGAPKSEIGMEDNETPVHDVTLSPFWIGRYEITIEQFQKFVDATNRNISVWTVYDYGRKRDYSFVAPGFPQENNHPAVAITWFDAMDFCSWLSEKTGKHYTLPTEAQWEYACRGGTSTRFFWGSKAIYGKKYLNGADQSLSAHENVNNPFQYNDGYRYTSPVGSFEPNPFGLYDMLGNAWEWCLDEDEWGFYAVSPVKDPLPITTEEDMCARGFCRIYRGGSYSYGSNSCRSANRTATNPSICNPQIGFRIAINE